MDAMHLHAAVRDRASIDDGHRVLERKIGALQTALRRRPRGVDVEALKDELLGCLERHQALEKAIMAAYAYPLSSTHLEAHDAFRDQFKAILASIDTEVISNDNVAKLLTRVHQHHVKYYDDILSRYLADKYALQAVDDGMGI